MIESSHETRIPPANQEKRSKFAMIPFLITFGFMFVTWIVLSGNFSGLLIGLGLFSSALIAFFFHDLLFPSFTTGHIRIFFKFIAYIPWLVLEIIKANFHLLKIVFSPNMKALIDPHIITFQTDLTADLSITTLANSITLTPGTITVTAARDGVFRVHAIDRPSADALPGQMLKKMTQIYGEDK